MFLTLLVADCYIFPIPFVFNPGINTKMIMAAVGLILVCFDSASHKSDFINRQFLVLSLWGIAVSMCGLLSVVINATNDYTYSTYIVSMWVWIFAAYVVARMIKSVHGSVSWFLVSNYIIAVCVFQCLFAIGFEYNESLVDFILSHSNVLKMYYSGMDRMQGISCGLDPAGIRFAAGLVILGYAAANRDAKKNSYWVTIYYMCAFALITVVGNMISRTTVVGTIMVLAYWICLPVFEKENKRTILSLWQIAGISLLVVIPILVYYYNSDALFRENIRFGFEGFFSLAERGSWEVSSNEILKSMVVFPDNAKTWLIGDGYIENPSEGLDPFYVGEIFHGYYMGTDIGYLRFIFYFGLIGLACFIGFMAYSAYCCCQRFPKNKLLFVALLLLNMIIWAKVSTDIFCVFALFLATPPSFMRVDEEVETPNLVA